MQLSGAGTAHVLHFEGIYLYAYKDSAGVLTQGAGHTAMAGEPLPRAGTTWNLATSIAVFQKDMVKYGNAVVKRLGALTQPQYDGFTSFHFNTGAISSGSVDEKWLRGDTTAAIATLKAYVNAGGQRLSGLVRRRESEAKIILSGQYGNPTILVKPSASSKGESLTWSQIQTRIQATAIPVAPNRGEDASFTPIVVPKPPVPTKKSPLDNNVLAQLGAFIVKAFRSIFP